MKTQKGSAPMFHGQKSHDGEVHVTEKSGDKLLQTSSVVEPKKGEEHYHYASEESPEYKPKIE